MGDKYLSFVSNEDLLECVEWVINGYSNCKNDLNMEKLQSQIIDPFKMVFDIYNYEYTANNWIFNEKIRQDDKTVNNTIGEFHQKLLGKVDGWIDLGIGDSTKVDLKNEDETKFIEIKNKHNTVNAGSKDKVRDNLETIVEKYREAKAYWAYIITKKKPEVAVWKYSNYPVNDRIKVVNGRCVYQLVTGKPNALDEVWESLPVALNDSLDIILDEKEKKELKWFFKYAFNNHERRNLLKKSWITD